MLNPAQFLQAFFLLAASTIVFLNCIPIIREKLVAYGPRTAAPAKTAPNATKKPHSQKTNLENSIESIASLQVPHAYFHHFYIVSVASSLFWAIQLLTNGKLLQRLTAAALIPAPSTTSMSVEQIQLTWALMTIQGLRRQFESSMFAKPSTSKMWIVHYLLGIIFYLAMGVAVWIEGAETLSNHPTHNLLTLKISPPSLRTTLTLPLFIVASGLQHDTHAYLSSLPKYTLPQHPIFKVLLCPHYTAECLIYLSLAMIAGPGPWVWWSGVNFNKTLFTAFIFVAANLGVTAMGTKRWYEGKFGSEAVRGRWVMVPFVW